MLRAVLTHLDERLDCTSLTQARGPFLRQHLRTHPVPFCSLCWRFLCGLGSTQTLSKPFARYPLSYTQSTNYSVALHDLRCTGEGGGPQRPGAFCNRTEPEPPTPCMDGSACFVFPTHRCCLTPQYGHGPKSGGMHLVLGEPVAPNVISDQNDHCQTSATSAGRGEFPILLDYSSQNRHVRLNFLL